ncbi:MAG: response regulator [Butyrivibrio sp.]|nr:response regulator [Butyrivibrio sp.]
MEKMRVLAVDDNIVNLATLEQELKDKYEVIPMSSGRRAIKFLYKEKVDLILLDVQMPIMDGIETLKEIRNLEDGLTIPVIFLTAKKDKMTVVEGSKLGIMDYVVKPFNTEDLHERIERALKRHGALPMEGRELYKRVKDIIEYIHSEKIRAAIVSTNEILGYQIDEEISGRMSTAVQKLKEGDLEAGERILSRILKVLEKSNDVGNRTNTIPISLGELNSRLLYVLDDLENFKIQEAALKIDDLLRYDIPQTVLDACNVAHDRLAEYDDDAAEKIIRNTLDELGKHGHI